MGETPRGNPEVTAIQLLAKYNFSFFLIIDKITRSVKRMISHQI
jgi:hypothetical protein